MFMQVYGVMTDFDYFKWDFMIFGIGNEYQDVHSDLYKLNNDFSGGLGQEKIAYGLLCCKQTPKQGWVCE